MDMNPPPALARRSLSTKLLLLTVLFVLLAEAVVMIPSVAKQRIDWLEMRLEEAYLVHLAIEGVDERTMSEETARQLFATANILGVTINRNNMRELVLAPEIDPHGPPRMLRADLRDRAPLKLIADAWTTMFSRGDDLIQVSGAPHFAENEAVDIIVSQRALRGNLLIYARNILGLSLVISSLTAALVYWALNRMIVRPVTRLTDSMAKFEADPEKTAHIHAPSRRQDEIGAAERSLAAMQKRINELLNEQRRLAALGAGISKLSHDLRNILASAQLMSDRLARSDDERVRKLSPRIVSAINRAIALSCDTLAFGTMEARALNKETFPLRALVSEVFEDNAAMGVSFNNAVANDLAATADRTHLYRSLFNLVRNAVDAIREQAGEAAPGVDPDKEIGAVTIEAARQFESIVIRVIDTGPGIPDDVRADLFEPFKGSRKPDGAGLGAAIAAEIIRAHGGEIILARSDASGTAFKIALPDAPSDYSAFPKRGNRFSDRTRDRIRL
jgi:signal transduction histidine kinase